jgi:hypothetical protein
MAAGPLTLVVAEDEAGHTPLDYANGSEQVCSMPVLAQRADRRRSSSQHETGQEIVPPVDRDHLKRPANDLDLHSPDGFGLVPQVVRDSNLSRGAGDVGESE